MAVHAPDDSFCAEILDHLTLPVIVAGADGSIRYANTSGRAVLDEHGLVVATGNVLSGLHAEDDGRLKSAIADTCTTKAGHVVGMGTDHAQRVVAIVLPFQEKTRSGPGHALVILRSGIGFSDILVHSLRHMFKLSSAEAAIAIALSTGADLNEVAKERGVTLNTLRSQVASIMGRTGTHRQAELVALITRIDGLLLNGQTPETMPMPNAGAPVSHAFE